MARVFISYRRDDAAGEAGRLYDRLVARFGRDQVFMDVTGIEPGVDFVSAIDSAVGSCAVLLVVIGPGWASVTDSSGRRRLDDPHDFVRLETGAALRRGIRVIPVLVDHAAMPSAEVLPEDLRPLARRQALEISHAQWQGTTAELITALERVLEQPAEVSTDGTGIGATKPGDSGEPPGRSPARGTGDGGTRRLYARTATLLAVGAAVVATAASSGWWLSRPSDGAKPSDAGTAPARPVVAAAAPSATPAPSPAAPGANGAVKPTPSAPAAGPAPVAGTQAPDTTPNAPTKAAKPKESPPQAPAVPARRSGTDARESATARDAAGRRTPEAAKAPDATPASGADARRAAPSGATAHAPPATVAESAASAAPAATPPPAALAKASPAARPTESPPEAATRTLQPRPGDTWVYRSRSIWPQVPPRTFTHTVVAAGAAEVRETMKVDATDNADVQRFAPGVAVIERIAGSVVRQEVSPFLLAWGVPSTGAKWKLSAIPGDGAFRDGWYGEARVTGEESVSVPAGSFDTIRLLVESNRLPDQFSRLAAQEPGRIQHLVWYAPKVRRAVRHTRTVWSQQGRQLDQDIYELVSFQLR